MQTVTETGGHAVIRDLTGHGIGRELHMKPYLPCYADTRSKQDVFGVDQTIAIEIMSSMGDYHLIEEPDGGPLNSRRLYHGHVRRNRLYHRSRPPHPSPKIN